MAGDAGVSSSRPHGVCAALPFRVHHEVSQAGAARRDWHGSADPIREICRSADIEIMQGHIRPDHVHLLLSVPPHLAPSRVMQAIKGKTSHHLLQDRRRLRSEFWGRHLWARGYFVCTSGNVTDEVIARYIKHQGAEPEDDDRLRVSEE